MSNKLSRFFIIPIVLKNKTLLIVLLCILFSALSLYHYFSNKLYYVGSDVFYYLSLADSFVNTGQITNLSVSPPGGISSPQNGIVFVFSIFKLANFSSDTIIKIVSFINYFLYIVSFYPIYKIAKSYKFSWVKISLLAVVYYSHWVVYRLQMIPINDGIYNVLIFWLIYFVYDRLRFGRLHLIPFTILSLMGPHFRISTFVVLIVAIITSFFFKKWKTLLYYSSIFSLSLLLFGFVYNSSVIKNPKQHTAQVVNYASHLNEEVVVKISKTKLIIKDIDELLLTRIPRLFLVDFKKEISWLNMSYVIFLIAPLYFLIKSIKTKKSHDFFLATVIFSAYLFVLYLGIISHRYFLYTYIFSVLLFIRLFYHRRPGKILVISYIVSILLFSIYPLLIKRQNQCLPKLFQELRNKQITIKNSDLLLSSLPRHSYFFLGHPGYRGKLTPGRIHSKTIYVVDTNSKIRGYIDKYHQQYSGQLIFQPIYHTTAPDASCGFGKLVVSQ